MTPGGHGLLHVAVLPPLRAAGDALSVLELHPRERERGREGEREREGRRDGVPCSPILAIARIHHPAKALKRLALGANIRVRTPMPNLLSLSLSLSLSLCLSLSLRVQHTAFAI